MKMNDLAQYGVGFETVVPFTDREAEILAEEGRASVRETYDPVNTGRPIVIKCKTMAQGGQHHVAKLVDVGEFLEDIFEETIETSPAKGAIKAKTEVRESVEYVITLRSLNIKHTLPGDKFSRERALEFAVKLALACYGKSYNYVEDVKATGKPTIGHTRDVLVEFGLINPAKLPKPLPKRPQQTHGGRGQNAVSPQEVEGLTGVRLG